MSDEKKCTQEKKVQFRIRKGEAEDAEHIRNLIVELAVYEKESPSIVEVTTGAKTY
jgi:hypothetical protein